MRPIRAPKACAAAALVALFALAGCSGDVTDNLGGVVDSGAAGQDVANAADLGGGGEDTGEAADATGSDVQGDDTGGAGDASADDALGGSDAPVDDAGADDAGEQPDGGEVPDAGDDPDSGDDPDTAGSDAGGADDVVEPDAGGGPAIPKSVHSASCATDADCLVPCGQGTCSAGTCSYTPKSGTCLVDIGGGEIACYGDGVVDDLAPCLRCDVSHAQSTLSSSAARLDFDDPDAEGLLLADAVSGGLTWSVSEARSVTGGKSLYFGDPKTKTYANGQHVAGTVTTPALDVPKHDGVSAALVFWLFLDTEETKDYDFLSVTAVDGADSAQIWHSDTIGGTTHGVWQRIEVPLEVYAGKQLSFIFTFNSVDGYVNAYEGAYLDGLSISTGCCGSAGECDDGNACSTDTCAAGGNGLPVCSYDLKADCCNSNADCDDSQPCTVDICSGEGGTCSFNAKPDCCLTDVDCDDGDSCTVDVCPKAGGTCASTNTCCQSDAECSSADPCLKGTCNGGACSFTNTCCTADAQCDDFNPCTTDFCTDGACTHEPVDAPGCCLVNPYLDEFESPQLTGWVPEGTNNKLEWHIKDVADAPSGNKVLAWGVPGSDKVDGQTSGTGSYVYINSDDIQLPPGQDAELSFKYKLDITNGSTSYNRFYFYLQVAGKNSNYLVYKFKSTANLQWQEFKYDVSALAGKTFKLRIRARIGGTSSTPPQGGGIYFDDFSITSNCKAKDCVANSECGVDKIPCVTGQCSVGQCNFPSTCCASDAECDDQNLCTTDTCSGGQCKFAAIKGCCMGDADCNDVNPCTTDICPAAGQQCINQPVGGCCLADADCNDGNACTFDACVQNKCEYSPSCCGSDADCNDNDDKCTNDVCVGGTCAYNPTGAAGCCEPEVWVNGFNAADTKGMTFNNSGGPTQGWQIWLNPNNPPGPKSPPGVLYYGNPSTGNFNFSSNNGKARTPKIELPATTSSELKFWHYQDTESGTTYDKIFVYLYVNGSKQTLYDKSKGFQSKTWVERKFDLSAHKGKTVEIEFEFNTVDSVANSGLGVVIDDLQIITDCGS